ncbi:MAG: hypothetical protein MJ219_03350 [Mycoplasmoidaceae bacterium]|nr:hypothetical protein [Mycoplasmoidaceae bacterium]
MIAELIVSEGEIGSPSLSWLHPENTNLLPEELVFSIFGQFIRPNKIPLSTSCVADPCVISSPSPLASKVIVIVVTGFGPGLISNEQPTVKTPNVDMGIKHNAFFVQLKCFIYSPLFRKTIDDIIIVKIPTINNTIIAIPKGERFKKIDCSACVVVFLTETNDHQ